MCINTLKVSNVQAMGILSVYILGLNAIAGLLRYKGWKIKLQSGQVSDKCFGVKDGKFAQRAGNEDFQDEEFILH